MTAISIQDLIGRVVLSALNHLSVMVSGPPGIGKSEAFKQARDLIAKGGTLEVGGTLVPDGSGGIKRVGGRTITVKAQPVTLIIMHLVTYDPTDIGGIPCTVVRDGRTIAEFVPHGELLKLIDATHLTIVFLDDLGQANNAVQAAAMQLVLERAINGHQLPECVTFGAATNRRQDKAAVGGIIQPLINRFHVYEGTWVLDDWCIWALSSGLVTDEVVAFTRWHEEYQKTGASLNDWKPSQGIENSPTPRGMRRMSDLIRIGLDSHIDVESAVGGGMATSWIAFQKLVGQVPDLDLLLRDPAKAPIPSDAGVQYALTQGLFSRARKNPKVMPQVCDYLTRFGNDGTLGTEKLLAITFIRDLDTCDNRDELLSGAVPLITAFGDLMTRSMR